MKEEMNNWFFIQSFIANTHHSDVHSQCIVHSVAGGPGSVCYAGFMVQFFDPLTGSCLFGLRVQCFNFVSLGGHRKILLFALLARTT